VVLLNVCSPVGVATLPKNPKILGFSIGAPEQFYDNCCEKVLLMSRAKNIQRCSNGLYYLRVYVPTQLIPRFGCREITRSLGTNCLRKAEHLAITMKAQIYAAIGMATTFNLFEAVFYEFSFPDTF